MRVNFFTQGGGCRNKVPEDMVDAGTIATFKRRLNRYTERKGLKGYGPNANGQAWLSWAKGSVSVLYGSMSPNLFTQQFCSY